MNSTDLEVLFEDNHLIAVYKPSGVLVQGDKTGDQPLVDIVKSYIVQKYNKPGAAFLGVIHRIDRPTSGIVVFAKTSKALSRMNKSFADREIHKTYWALVEGHPDPIEGDLEHYLVRKPEKNKSFAHQKPVPNSKRAHLTYKCIHRLERFSLVQIELHTGRHHQIRAQLSGIGHPIKGDFKYGAKRSNLNGSIDLVAQHLEFQHPVQDHRVVLTLKSPLLSIKIDEPFDS